MSTGKLHLQALPSDAPVLLILPGLTGGSHDAYPQYACVQARQQGFRQVFIQHHSCAPLRDTQLGWCSALM